MNDSPGDRGVGEMTDATKLPRSAALAVLGLSRHASAREITAAYRRLAKATHPDVTGPADHDAGRRFAALTEAYRALTSISPDPAAIASTQSPCPTSSPSAAVSMPPRGPVL